MKTEPEIIAPADASAALPAERLDQGSPIWTAALAAEIALAVYPVAEVCGRHGVTKEQWAEISRDEGFRGAVEEARRLLDHPDARFKAKANLYAEEMLDELRRLATAGVEVPANVKSDSAKQIIKIAGLDASESRASAGGTHPLTINIKLD